ncbi:penicillin-binding transpeptidase domain-containing protein [Calderihabitans maritimus]|nr:penicillin-binding transpeptidase domain-containing protein [Calderihabitans maritimus]
MNSRRLIFLAGLFSILFFLLEAKLFYLQIVKGQELAVQAIQYRTELFPYEDYPRGDIVDRWGRSLTDRGERPVVVVFPGMIEDREKTAEKLEEILAIPSAFLMRRMSEIEREKSAQPFVLKVNVDSQMVRELQNYPIPGVYLLPMITRYGPRSVAVHVIGYVGSQKQKKQTEGSEDVGIETIYEDVLNRGSHRYYWRALVDARGRLIPGLGFKKIASSEDHVPRNRVVLTIDREIQEIVERAIDSWVKKGAVVVLDVASGDVLAMASRPAFHQNWLDNGCQPEPGSFVNRALEPYHPGAILKLVVAARALEEQVNGWQLIGYPQTKPFRAGAKVAIKGSLGQEEFLLSPLQAANLLRTVARGGLYSPPRLVLEIQNGSGEVTKFFALPPSQRVMSSGTADQLQLILKPVFLSQSKFQDRQGNYYAAGVSGRNTYITVPSEAANGTVLPQTVIPDWFVGYAPLENPRYAVAVLVEEEKFDGYMAEQLFRYILKEILEKESVRAEAGNP